MRDSRQPRVVLPLRAQDALSPDWAAGDAQEISGMFGAPARQAPASQKDRKSFSWR